jgi:hypothetical protein
MHAICEEIKRLYDQDLTLAAIAARVGYSTELVRRSLASWFGSRGLVRPDGRTRRKDLPRKPGSRRATGT